MYLAQPINLAAVDIGRHIKNGELICQGQRDILHKNFYSFTYPDYPFINHHWLSGVIFYKVFQAFGFSGVGVFYIGIVLLALVLFLLAAGRYAPFPLVFFFASLSFLLLVDRKEIRPEGFSLLFLGVYFYLLQSWQQRRIDGRWLMIILPCVQLIWVNTHIFFIMGPLLVSIFLWQKTDKFQAQTLYKLLLAVTAVNLLNPSGLWGALTPLNIFKEFGYRLAENQNVFFMMKRFADDKAYFYYLLVSAIAIVGVAIAMARDGWRKHLPMAVLTLFLMGAGMKAVRLMTPFAFFFIPLSCYFYGPWLSKFRMPLAGCALIFLSFILITTPPSPGIGLAPGINQSAEFFKREGLKGPVFSNYDIGGYLIYHLAPQEKVFVDNRQEAFPPDFFKKVYVPMQEKSEVWHQQLSKYGFNVVYFYRHDLTPWGQQFLIDRLSDPDWAPVFVDAYTIIFARRGSVNQDAINHFELPKNMFAITHN